MNFTMLTNTCNSSSEGKTNKQKDYAIHGNKVDRLFNAFDAISAIIVSSNSG